MLNEPAKPLERVIDAASSENKEILPSSKKSPMKKLQDARDAKKGTQDSAFKRPMVVDCEPSLYQAFMDANSFNYQIPAKENSGEISSDGEFNEMEQVVPFLDGGGGEPDVVVVTEYENLVKRRFAGQ